MNAPLAPLQMQAVQQQTELVDAEVQALKQLSQLEAQLQTERREAATAASAAQERMAKLEKDLAAAVAAAGTAAGGAAAATPATGAVDPAIAECMKCVRGRGWLARCGRGHACACTAELPAAHPPRSPRSHWRPPLGACRAGAAYTAKLEAEAKVEGSMEVRGSTWDGRDGRRGDCPALAACAGQMPALGAASTRRRRPCHPC